ncbi:hypothetical protein [Mycolicibacterium sp. 120270]|uniref:hypothetical protein n=1 Tax=Mycolicibacterium sp. 120270 TaxID=3090600 RepID=UPI00299E8E02|nr:hypothetical protein [Mycolicibacterium sp. 120270]MDX1887881.1 hypothetical protein [Mycolicibacterium sp. 120270]
MQHSFLKQEGNAEDGHHRLTLSAPVPALPVPHLLPPRLALLSFLPRGLDRRGPGPFPTRRPHPLNIGSNLRTDPPRPLRLLTPVVYALVHHFLSGTTSEVRIRPRPCGVDPGDQTPLRADERMPITSRRQMRGQFLRCSA